MTVSWLWVSQCHPAVGLLLYSCAVVKEKDSFQVYFVSHNFIFIKIGQMIALVWQETDFSNCVLLSTAKYFFREEDVKFSTAGWRRSIRVVLETVVKSDILNTVSAVTSLWAYGVKKSLALRHNSLCCKAKALLGMWTGLVDLLTLQLQLCGCIRLIPAWLSGYPL